MFERPSQLPDGLTGDVVSAAGKVSPPLAVGTLSASGFSLQDWVFIATLTYLALQILVLVYKFARDLRRDRKERADG